MMKQQQRRQHRWLWQHDKAMAMMSFERQKKDTDYPPSQPQAMIKNSTSATSAKNRQVLSATLPANLPPQTMSLVPSILILL